MKKRPLARVRTTAEAIAMHRWVLPVPVPPMKITFLDAKRVSAKAERVDIFEDRELGAADAIADRACLPVGAFGPDQAGDERIDLIAPGKTLTGNLIEAGAH
jgi:hypothetical protein